MQSSILNEFKRDRLFGREITNVIDNKPYKNERESFMARKDVNISLDPPKRNLSNFNKPVRVVNKTMTSRPVEAKETHTIQNDIQYVPEYFEENLRFMMQQENKNETITNYFLTQKDLNQSMRVILFDWMLDVHMRFKMFPQTLFIACTITDRFLTKKEIPRSKLQLVGATALFIAAKYEQTYEVPQLDEMISLCAKAFSKLQFLDMESTILKVLDFKLIIDSCYKFLQPFAKIENLESKHFSLCRYLLEISLYDIKMAKFKPSVMAAASILLVNKLSKKTEVWSDTMIAATGYVESDLKSCTKEIFYLLEKVESMTQAKNLRKKFSSTSLHEVAKIKIEKVEKVSQ